jgi:hypothetical protein
MPTSVEQRRAARASFLRAANWTDPGGSARTGVTNRAALNFSSPSRHPVWRLPRGIGILTQVCCYRFLVVRALAAAPVVFRKMQRKNLH